MTAVAAVQLAALFDCSERTIRDLAQRGVLAKVGRDRYDAPASVTAYIRHLREQPSARGSGSGDLNPEQERARKDRALADKTELQNAVTRGELVSAEDAEAAWVEMISIARSRLLAMPTKLGPALATMTTATEVQSAIEAEVTAALEDLAGTLVEGSEDPRAGGADSSG
ncbi:hypothetical protein [Chelatococcus reniformis]|uniref:Terminase small subunit, Nu1 n=1 Tax=Chelatococcus reniformis TaxID=1494448 RepID=A0A916UVG2_9HYPH|nr:hypothetical protein [Chelatococcus reniformis]GGC90457.1 hypothetical protein GCM10010994_55340 [Chelatococcus reniformis]